MKENSSRIRIGAFSRKLFNYHAYILNIIYRGKFIKGSVKNKMSRAALDDDFRVLPS